MFPSRCPADFVPLTASFPSFHCFSCVISCIWWDKTTWSQKCNTFSTHWQYFLLFCNKMRLIPRRRKKPCLLVNHSSDECWFSSFSCTVSSQHSAWFCAPVNPWKVWSILNNIYSYYKKCMKSICLYMQSHVYYKYISFIKIKSNVFLHSHVLFWFNQVTEHIHACYGIQILLNWCSFL